jgi:hypothetical protein
MTYCGACEPEGPVEAIFPGTPCGQVRTVRDDRVRLPDADEINALVDGYAREHDVRNSPLEAR